MARAYASPAGRIVRIWMTKRRIPRSLRQRVLTTSRQRCAYCHTPTSITGTRLVIDHIVPEAAGGKTEEENLCVSCHSCNEFKGVQQEARDQETGQLAPIFHPYRQVWREHFGWSTDGSRIFGRTPTGRASVEALQLNHPVIVEARLRWVHVGWHPPADDIGD